MTCIILSIGIGVRRSNSLCTMPRTFPPPYHPTGDADADRLAFFHVLERLKVPISTAIRTDAHHTQTQQRTGWVEHNVSRESGPGITDVL